MKAYHIYILTDPLDGLVKYVGCTVNPKSRLSNHISQCSDASCGGLKKVKWIRDLKENNVRPTMTIVRACDTIEQAKIIEKQTYDLFNQGQLLCSDPEKLKYTEKVNLSGR